MSVSFQVAARIVRPVSDVFDAVVNPDRLSAYFTTGGASGPLTEGTRVSWSFHDFPGPVEVRVAEVVKDSKLVLHWSARDADPSDGRQTTITMDFLALEDGRTLVTIREEGWLETAKGREISYDNCEGWTQMLCSLKAWLEHGVNLREGYYK